MLIRTKIIVPSLRSNLLIRTELIEQLNESKDYPFVFLSGPAGSGKTSLVCQWLQEEDLRVAWYSLDQEDNEPDSFFRYILAAFVKADKSLNETMGPMLGNQQQLSGDLVVPLIIESMTHTDRTIHLILDDFHQVTNKKILNALARLIQYMPAHLQLVALSRRHRLPAVMDVVVFKKERLEITASDLKFTNKETNYFFTNIIQTAIPAEKIRKLNQHAEGWAAGLQLIGLEVRSKGTGFDLPKILNQANEQVASYLVYEILSMQPEKIRNFVFATALLDRFNPEVCAAMTGQNDATGILAYIASMNLFLIPLDADNRWYRYHHMFSEVIRRRVTIDDPALVSSSLQKAAKWFAENRLIEDAVRSAFRSGDFDFAADFMEDHIFQYVEQLNPSGGLRWILRLPPDLLNRRVLLRLYQCHLLMILLEFSKLKEILSTLEIGSNQCLKRYSPEKQTLCKDFTIFHKCSLGILYATRLEEITQFKALSKKISSHNSYLKWGIKLNFAFNLIIKGDISLAETSLADTSEPTSSTNQLLKIIFVDKAKAHIARLRGRLNQAEAIITHAHTEIDRHGMRHTPLAYILHRHLGYIFYLQNRLAEAKQCLTTAVRYSEYSDLIDQVISGNELRLLIFQAEGEKEQAAEYFKQLSTYALKFGLPDFTRALEACAARMAIDQKNLTPAVLWSRQRKIDPDEPFSLLFAMECQTQARLYYGQKTYKKAFLLLEGLRNRCIKRGLLDLVLQIDILRSAALNALNQHETAKSVLMEVLAFSENKGYVRPFINDAEHIAPILSEIGKELPDSAVSPYLENILNACRIPHRQPEWLNGNESRGNTPLTRREVEILAWMAQGAKNKEISQKESISISTVKTHVHRILNKLGVQTRTKAIIKAKSMNIIRSP